MNRFYVKCNTGLKWVNTRFVEKYAEKPPLNTQFDAKHDNLVSLMLWNNLFSNYDLKS